MADAVSGYNIIAKLGEGARSQVFHVVKPDTGEVFALKRVIREAGEDTRFLDQAINEFNVSNKVRRHPVLRRIFDLRRIRRLFRLSEVHVVMEFVDGASLDKARPTQLDRVISLMRQVAEGLGAMHEAGILHADIKPNNILLAFDGSVRIIDFGQCCEIGFRKPRIQGTPDYIAPEQVERLALTPETDIYNLGATLYWAVTGRTLPTVLSKSAKKLETGRRPPVPDPRELNPEVPPALAKLVMDCCQYDRGNRPRSMKDVVARLELSSFARAATPPAGTSGGSD